MLILVSRGKDGINRSKVYIYKSKQYNLQLYIEFGCLQSAEPKADALPLDAAAASRLLGSSLDPDDQVGGRGNAGFVDDHRFTLMPYCALRL